MLASTFDVIRLFFNALRARDLYAMDRRQGYLWQLQLQVFLLQAILRVGKETPALAVPGTATLLKATTTTHHFCMEGYSSFDKCAEC